MCIVCGALRCMMCVSPSVLQGPARVCSRRSAQGILESGGSTPGTAALLHNLLLRLVGVDRGHFGRRE